MYEQSNQSNNTEPFFEISDLQPLRNQLSRSNSSFNITSSEKPLEPQPQTTTTTTTYNNNSKLKQWFIKFYQSKFLSPIIIFITLLIVFFIALGSYLGYKSSISIEKGDGIGVDLGEINSGVALYGSVTNVDIEEKKLELRFTFSGCGFDFTDDATSNQDCGVLNRNISVFINENATLAKFESEDAKMETISLRNGAIGKYEPEDIIWSQNPQDMKSLELTFTPSFNIEIPFDWTQTRSSIKSDPTSYPFDEYKAYITFLAWDAGRNASEPNLGHFSDFSFIRTTGTYPNYVITSVDYPTLQNDVRRTIQISIRRSNAVRAFSISIIIMMWAVTIAILWSAILAAVYRRPVMGETYVVTSAALFALPEVRDKLPGGPEFGTLSDSLGYFLCLPIVSASIAVLLFCMLYPPKNDPKRNH